jgi:anti-sigma B factor antagonist
MTSLDPGPVPSTTRVTESQSVGLRAIAVHEQGRVAVVVHGELDLGSAPVLRREISALLALPIETIELDLDGLEFVDSGGVRLLADLRRDASEHRIPLSISAASAPVRNVLELTGRTDLLDATP